MKAENRRAVIAALFANLGLAIAKFVGYGATGAASLLAEAVHSVADTTNQVLLLWGGRAAARKPTPDHPYGFGRERYFWSFAVALVIFTLGGGFAIFEGVSKFIHPHEVTNPGWAIGILSVGILMEGASLRIAIRAARKSRGQSSWWQYVKRSRNPELPVVLLEDLGAVLGLSVALIGISLASLTGNGRYDALGSIFIGILLCFIAVILATELKSLLIGEPATAEEEDLIRGALLDDTAVQRLIHMRTQHMGPDQVLVGTKLHFDPNLSMRQLAEAINRAEERVRAAVPTVRIIYIEPDLYIEPRSATPD